MAVGKAGGVGKSKAGAKTGREDRRKHERLECDGFAEVVVNDAAFLFRGSIHDVSLTGCYIQSHARLRLDRGAAVNLRFLVDGDAFNIQARLMIVRPGAGAGFEFLFDSPEPQERISGLIDKLKIPFTAHVAVSGSKLDKESNGTGSRTLWERSR